MSIEELLMFRFEVIIDYPLCPFKINDIIYNKFKHVFGTNDTNQVMTLKDIEKYPHIFRKLHWSEKRKEEQMPDYIKKGKDFVKIEKWDFENEWIPIKNLNKTGFEKFIFDFENYLPCSKEEYLSNCNKA